MMAAGYDDSEGDGKLLTRQSLGWNSSPSNRHCIGQAQRFEGGGARGRVPSNPVLAQIMFERSLTEPQVHPKSETWRMSFSVLVRWTVGPDLSLFQSQDF